MNIKYIIEIMFWVSLAGMMLLNQFFETDAWYISLQRALVPGFIGYWVMLDATEREWKKERIMKYSLFSLFAPPITVPIYLVKSRGLKGTGKFVWNFSLYLFAFFFIITISMGILSGELFKPTLGNKY